MAGDDQVLLLPAPDPRDDAEQLFVVEQLCGLQVPDGQHPIIIPRYQITLQNIELSDLIPLQILIIIHVDLLEMFIKLLVSCGIYFTVERGAG